MNIKNILERIQIIKITILIALLGAYGGQGHKSYRRMGIPIMIVLFSLCQLKNLWTLTIFSMIGAFSTGYGIPSPDDDDPSSLGKFWMKVFKNNEYLANIFTRGTIGFLVSLSLLSIPILKTNWIIYIISSLLLIGTYGMISWRDLGVIKMGDCNLLVTDLIVYGVIGLFGGILIYF